VSEAYIKTNMGVDQFQVRGAAQHSIRRNICSYSVCFVYDSARSRMDQ